MQNILIFLIKGIEKISIMVYNIYANSFTVCCINTVYAKTFHNVRHRNIVYQPSVQRRGFPFREDVMIERGLYYATRDFAELIKSVVSCLEYLLLKMQIKTISVSILPMLKINC